MNLANIANLFSLLVSNISIDERSPTITELEKRVATRLFDYLQNLLTTYNHAHIPTLSTETSSTDDVLASPDIDFFHLDDDLSGIEFGSDGPGEEDTSEDDDDDDYTPADSTSFGQVHWTMEEMTKVVRFKKANPKYAFKTIQHSFPRLTDHKALARMIEHVEHHGRYKDKVLEIDKVVYEKFLIARRQYLPIHDIDLRRWALDHAKVLDFEFKASPTWVNNFKRKHRITSRHVTMTYTNRQVANLQTINESASTFRKEVLDTVINYPLDQIFNSDQSGYTYEYHSTRTLSEKGEKLTAVAVSSQNKCTHSYTIQPIIDYTGRVRGKLYLCLQEVQGHMGPQVKKMVEDFCPPNVEITCSTSGKLTSSLFQRWVERVLFPLVDDECLILLDSWTGQQSDGNFAVFASSEKSCNRLKIPEKTTGTTQPLDVYFFRQWKLVAKRCYDRAMLDHIDINLGDRLNIIRLQSLIHNQFSHDQFQPMGHFAWYLAGLRPDPPGKFKNASEILFPHDGGPCSSMNCMEHFFIRCSHCSADLCFKHFFIDNHTHF